MLQYISKKRTTAVHIVIYLIVIFLIFIVMDSIAPFREPIPGTDSGIFLYIGDLILDGKYPYLDAWDHKGPMVFYINALGLSLQGNSLCGIWIIQIIAIVFAAFIGYKLLLQAFGFWPSVFGTFMWLFGLPLVIDGGNLTEEYALPFQFAMLLFFWKSLHSKNTLNSFLIGLFAALAFWLRANIVGIPIAIGLFQLWYAFSIKSLAEWKKLLFMILGGLSVSLVIIIVFSMQNNLNGLLDGSFLFNFRYTESTLINQWNSFSLGVRIMPSLSLFAFAGWLFILVSLNMKNGITNSRRQLATVLALVFPLELLLVSLSGRSFPHYYMSLLPVYALSAGYFLAFISGSVFQKNTANPMGSYSNAILGIVLLIAANLFPLISAAPPALNTIETVISTRELPKAISSSIKLEQAVLFINEYLSPDDTLVLWGKDLSINWVTGFSNPSRHIFQDHFFVPGYATQELINEYIDDLYTHRPIIVDTTVKSGFIPSLGTRLIKLPKVVRPLYNFVISNFAQVGVIEGPGWPVYKFVGELNIK